MRQARRNTSASRPSTDFRDFTGLPVPTPESFQNAMNSEYTMGPSTPVPAPSFVPWIADAVTPGSPYSTDSAGSYPEEIGTPPYGSFSMDPYTAPNMWVNYDAMPQHPSHWRVSSIDSGDDSTPPPMTMDPYYSATVQVFTTGFSELSFARGGQYTQTVADTTSFPPLLPAPETVKAEDNLDEFESEWEDSDSDSSTARRPTSRPNGRRASHMSSVMQLGRWSSPVNTFEGGQPRSYHCTHCEKSFQRPEHCRRHIRTVHGGDSAKTHTCQVPDCARPFSRRDNLGDHYYSHVHRGGRAGKNVKMTFAELCKLLGGKKENRRILRNVKRKLEKNRIRAKL
jgi:hypothetical protein